MCNDSSSRFSWDEAKYPVMSPLRETVETIQESVTKLEDDLKVNRFSHLFWRKPKHAGG